MSFEIIQHQRESANKTSVQHLGLEVAQKVNRFHKSFPIYEPTPLRELQNLASKLGVKNIMVKDESYRFGLNAFKVLGGSYAIGSYIAEKMDMDIDDLPYGKMISDEVRSEIGDITFISATDGNHGRGVAWTVNELKQKSVIYMPKGSAKERLDNIRAAGADAEITDLNYDDAVRLANKHANENGWVLVQDTSWDGYEDIPTHIMQGYTTMAYEVYRQMAEQKPTHIFLQAGVGSFASGVTGFFASVYGENQPIITIVEPNEAACIFKTMQANDGKIHPVTGDMDTIMAGLACGEPVTVGIDILRNYSDNYVSCPDYVAAQGMRVLSSPMNSDERIISGESGAAGIGLFYEIMTNKDLEEWKQKLKIDENSVLLFFNTEGDTDQESYNKIVWDGQYARPETI
ncbi:MAG: diaminopropionate ammonia-lyase [Lachnotalea sp.]